MGKTTNIPIRPVRHNSTTPQAPQMIQYMRPRHPRGPHLLPASIKRYLRFPAHLLFVAVSRVRHQVLRQLGVFEFVRCLPIQTPPEPLLQSPEKPFSQDTEQRYSLDPHRPNHSPSDIGQREPTPAPAGVSIHPIIESHEERLDNNVDLPRVKVLLCGLDNSLPDTMRFMSACFKYVKGVRHRDIHVHCVFETIDKEFDWFFDPNGIAPGGLLILCLTGHGAPTSYGVGVTDSFGQTLVDTIKLHTSINKLRVPCTLEVVIGACKSEGLIVRTRPIARDGHERCRQGNILERIKYIIQGAPQSSSSSLDGSQIVWAAAADDGIAYGRRTKIGSQDS
ncbi:hypothetical protein RHS01_04530 [Rhizoctonia solani]|uniref:Uncharacterized protein n=1 Tax=Rhizoctonia solani TaxID=456999 RepID=A0A8H7IDE5_9AGAM|nr:hypothetical protein RHS01_04530 [Rhizoctonia solani]